LMSNSDSECVNLNLIAFKFAESFDHMKKLFGVEFGV
jgi:hypothetical protein